MDPEATMQLILDTTGEEREMHIESLMDWLMKGGFAPELDDRCLLPAAPVCVAKWDNSSWLKHWLATGAHQSK